VVAGADDATAASGAAVPVGVVTEHSNLTFVSDVVNFAGTSSAKKSLFDPNWKFEDMGIGGLGYGNFDIIFDCLFTYYSARRPAPNPVSVIFLC